MNDANQNFENMCFKKKIKINYVNIELVVGKAT